MFLITAKFCMCPSIVSCCSCRWSFQDYKYHYSLACFYFLFLKLHSKYEMQTVVAEKKGREKAGFNNSLGEAFGIQGF